MTDLLHDLHAIQGQSPWVDNLKRAYLHDGTLARLVARGVRGVTSNPSIFQKAISGSPDYDAQFTSLVKAGAATEVAYWTMVIDDVRDACDVLRQVYDDSNGADGYVSLEVSPTAAEDTPRTEAAARELRGRVDRPNVMIKIPATIQGIPAIQTMVGEGRDINVTLIFSLERYEQVIDAYISGLEDLAERGGDVSAPASVGSFFISRVDTEVDRRLEKLATPPALALRGQAAIAQGVLANHLARQRFSGPRWDKLAAKGAKMQRPLWASTSTKNPAYPDTLYVDSLIGPDTVNTLPEATIEAFADHGTLARSVDSVPAIARAQATWTALGEVGIDMDDVARTLEGEGVASFVKSFEELLATLEARAHELAG